ncbi:hypothetical protein SASPL_138748 [Salvia splendens]|uniref:Uncharacterized protein n=1 Tax=Salvia splendens TaxID=180675 RepID=A0A8X8WU34_SALSN|nr:hypothetical protein SASPL_138748 [Salvia splendens]
MDLITGTLNITTAAAFLFFFFFPPYLAFKSLSYLCRSIFPENVAGKVVVVAGASSGIGEHIAYEYAKRGAFLVIGARRENALSEVAERAFMLGSPRAMPITINVSDDQECQRLIEEAINQFGRLDHLVVSAGVTPVSLFEDTFEVDNFSQAMVRYKLLGCGVCDLLWCTLLEDDEGEDGGDCFFHKLAQCAEAEFLQCRASKAVVVSFLETVRVEVAPDIGITIVTPGLTESEVTKGKFLNQEGKMVVDQDMRYVVMSAVPVETVGRCAEAVVKSACHGDSYLTWPTWMGATFFVKALCPEAVDWFNHWYLLTDPGVPPTQAISKKVVDLPRIKDMWPDSFRSPTIKTY